MNCNMRVGVKVNERREREYSVRGHKGWHVQKIVAWFDWPPYRHQKKTSLFMHVVDKLITAEEKEKEEEKTDFKLNHGIRAVWWLYTWNGRFCSLYTQRSTLVFVKFRIGTENVIDCHLTKIDLKWLQLANIVWISNSEKQFLRLLQFPLYKFINLV